MILSIDNDFYDLHEYINNCHRFKQYAEHRDKIRKAVFSFMDKYDIETFKLAMYMSREELEVLTDIEVEVWKGE